MNHFLMRTSFLKSGFFLFHKEHLRERVKNMMVRDIGDHDLHLGPQQPPGALRTGNMDNIKGAERKVLNNVRSNHWRIEVVSLPV